MSYVFSLTPRMLTVLLVSAGALCVLLFLLGFQIGARLSEPASAAPAAVSAPATAAPDMPPASETPRD